MYSLQKCNFTCQTHTQKKLCMSLLLSFFKSFLFLDFIITVVKIMHINDFIFSFLSFFQARSKSDKKRREVEQSFSKLSHAQRQEVCFVPVFNLKSRKYLKSIFRIVRIVMIFFFFGKILLSECNILSIKYVFCLLSKKNEIRCANFWNLWKRSIPFLVLNF